MTEQQIDAQKICNEIRMARLEKQIETVEAENYSLKQRIEELENEIRFVYPPLKEPVQVVGYWNTSGNMEVKK